jgi:hypothetical protein
MYSGGMSKEKNMTEFKIGQKVILNCKNLVSKKHLDDDGWFGVYGTIIGFTPKRIIADCDRGTGYYKPENVKNIL